MSGSRQMAAVAAIDLAEALDARGVVHDSENDETGALVLVVAAGRPGEVRVRAEWLTLRDRSELWFVVGAARLGRSGRAGEVAKDVESLSKMLAWSPRPTEGGRSRRAARLFGALAGLLRGWGVGRRDQAE